MTLLITGGIGTLGRPTVEALRAASIEPRVLSRRPGPLQLATNRRSDARATQHLLQAARSARVQHFVYLSIVGVDAVPLGYYRSKFTCEQLVAEQ